MTDDNAAPRPLKVTTCYDPTGRNKYCYALIEDTDDTRREHRAWHAHEERVKQGMRDGITERDDTISKLRQEVSDLRADVKGLGSDLQTIDIPAPVLGLEINRDGWISDDDDLDDPRSTYIDDTPGAVISDATSMFTNYQPATTDDDYPPRGTVA